jgi:hypothetical protein
MLIDIARSFLVVDQAVPIADPLSANAYPAALGLSLITGGRSRFGMWGPSSLALRVRLFGMINAARPRSPLSHEQG